MRLLVDRAFDVLRIPNRFIAQILNFTDDNPCLCIEYESPANIHAALAAAGSPIAPGADPAASKAAFSAWCQAQLPANSLVSNSGQELYHHLTDTQATEALTHGGLLVLPWAAAMMAAGATAGRVFKITPDGLGRNHIQHIRDIFG